MFTMKLPDLLIKEKHKRWPNGHMQHFDNRRVNQILEIIFTSQFNP